MSTPTFILFTESTVTRAVKDTRDGTLEGEAEQGVWLISEDPQTGSKYGMWDCTAGRFRAKMDGYTEFCHILEGEAEITNLDDGSTRTVRPGDSFVMTAGLELEWHVPVYIKKVFTISALAE